MTSEELTEMMAYARIEPFGPLQEDYRAGTIAAVLANVNRDPKSKPEPYSVGDFMPALREVLGQPRPEQRKLLGAGMTPDQLSALIDAQVFGRTLH